MLLNISLGLGIFAAISFVIFLVNLVIMLRSSGAKMEKVDRSGKYHHSEAEVGSVRTGTTYEKRKGYEMNVGAGMTTDEMVDGWKNKDAGTRNFVYIIAGFLIFFYCALVAGGLAMLHFEDTSGWALILVPTAFFILLGYQVISHRKKTKA